MKYCIALIFVFFCSKAFSTEINNGNELYHACNTEQEDCDRHIQAVYDTLEYRELICPPRSVTSKEVRDILVKKLSENPKTRHKPSIELLMGWLLKLFPCQ
ncbi:hypothetical protein WH96_07495 [Kiloniella spongiae]|uniref:Rap1a immunity protein domain-containing protein n=1 Tax=Kiloniella spongiae TaxID=1489064 RepID=A0A0H2MXQ1_9PROT|nr:Rap1a/Tai family immunity protein [Kiloniella spongiae]KLN61455.1 hypothetical protein WH96_07495 [Kiloniella spongiae]